MKLFFPGSFDPFTIGHADLVERALNLGCDVVIAVGINERKSLCLAACSAWKPYATTIRATPA